MTTLKITITDQDIDALSRLAQAEAAGIKNYIDRTPGPWEDSAEFLAYGSIVGSVINRVAANSWYGDSIQNVINKPSQYEPVSRYGGTSGTWVDLPPATNEVREAVSEYLRYLVDGNPSIIGGATHYLNPTIGYTDGSWQSWGQGMSPKYVIGETPFDSDGTLASNKQTHIFGNGDPGIFPKLYEIEYDGQSRIIDPAAGDAFGAFLPEACVLLPDWVPGVTGPFGFAEVAGSPLVIDVDGDGIELSALNGTGAVYWDIDADGFREASGWIAGGDGLLALDRNAIIACASYHFGHVDRRQERRV